MYILIFFVSHWYLSLFSQTFYLHRYSAHKMFTMNKFWEKFFYLFTYLTQGASYLTPRPYAIMHRMHHAFSDTEKDPHSPHFFKEVMSMMKYTYKIFSGIHNNKLQFDAKFDRNFPEWKTVDWMANTWTSRLLFGTGYVIFYVYFATSWWMYFLLPIHFLMGPVHGAIVNWAGHKYGYRNFNENDHSKNTLIFDFLMLGELFQNNHHHAGARPNFAAKWWEIDPVYPIIKILDKLKIIKLVR
ncbi:MAG: acyl-CoA desaturase [Bacteroidia bacterium]